MGEVPARGTVLPDDVRTLRGRPPPRLTGLQRAAVLGTAVLLAALPFVLPLSEKGAAALLAEPGRDDAGEVIDGRVTYANSVSAAALNVEPEQLVGRLWSELWPEAFAADLHAALVATLRAQAPLELVSFTLARARDN